MRRKKRYLVLPAVNSDTINVSADEEAGLVVRQPTDGDDPVVGDIRPSIDGSPDASIATALNVTTPGALETSRYSQGNAGDDAMFVQSSAVVGRRVDVPADSGDTVGPDRNFVIRPKMVALPDGNVVLSVIRGGDEQMPPQLFGGGTVDIIRGTPDGVWVDLSIDIADVPITDSALLYYADTDTLVFVGVSGRAYGEGWLVVLSSEDSGVSWTTRQRLYVQDALDLGYVIGTSDVFTSMDAAVLPSGRISALVNTQDKTFYFTSDDRGVSWDSGEVVEWSATTPASNPESSGVSVVCQPSGTLLAAVCYPNEDYDGAYPSDFTLSYTRIMTSSDGVSWTTNAVLDSNEYGESIHPALVVRQDGWPMLYMQVVSYTEDSGASATRVTCAGISCRMLERRGVTQADTTGDLFSTQSASPTLRGTHPFHLPNNSDIPGIVTGSVNPNLSSTLLIPHGFFGGIYAIPYKDGVLLANATVEETVDVSYPRVDHSAVLTYNLSYWQPLQERLGFCNNLLNEYSAGATIYSLGRVFTKTWDAYGYPEDWAWTKTVSGAGDGVLRDKATYGGCLFTQSVAADRVVYSDDVPLNTFGGALSTRDRRAVVRVLVKPTKGGSLTGDHTFVELKLTNGSSQRVGVTIRFLVSGDDVFVSAVDSYFGTVLGVPVLVTDAAIGSGWLEVLFGVWADSPSSVPRAVAYVRHVVDGYSDQSAFSAIVVDDFLQESVGTLSPTGQLRWGHDFPTSDSEAYWKSVHAHRPDYGFYNGASVNNYISPLAVPSLPYTDDASINTSTSYTNGGALQQSMAQITGDSGMYNFMRTAQATPLPRYLKNDIYVSWRGEALSTGNFDVETGHEFEAENVLRMPVQRQWRSTTDSDDVGVVFDAGAGRVMRPDALAIFGNQSPAIEVQFNNTDSWGTPAIRFVATAGDQVTVPSHPSNAYIHLWSSGNLYAVDRDSDKLGIREFGSGDLVKVWRPHQFYSQDNGPKYYCVVRYLDTSGELPQIRVEVFGVLDNGRDYVQLDGLAPQNVTYFAIYSDRMVFNLAGLWKDEGLDHLDGGYRYMRIAFRSPTSWNGFKGTLDENHTLGRVIPGTLFDLSTPDFKWGWTRQETPGTTLTLATNGYNKASRRHVPLRRFSAQYSRLAPDTLPTAINESPFSVDESHKTWQGALDLIRRLNIDNVECALVWDGSRLEDDIVFTGNEVQQQVDPAELLCVRLTDSGSLKQYAYECQSANFEEGDDEVPTPHMEGLSLTFDEQV